MSEGGQPPVHMSNQDAGYDLISPASYVLKKGERKKIPLGIAIQVPEGTYGRLCSRSSVVSEYGVSVEAGVIDRGYTGEIGILLNHRGTRPYVICKGHRIGQLILERCVQAPVAVVDSLPVTQRGAGGWGSTGK